MRDPRLCACTCHVWKRSWKSGFLHHGKFGSIMTRRPPLISVCMPVFNAERFVAEAVESILDANTEDFEFLIIDDGSSDGTPAILTRYANQDQRIRLSIRSNKGVVATLNELVDQACGELIARMDSDDISLPERLERQAAYLHGQSRLRCGWKSGASHRPGW